MDSGRYELTVPAYAGYSYEVYGNPTMGRKGHAKKIAIAKRLRSETTMTMVWIAEHTQMGSESNVRKLLNQTHKKKK